MGKTFLKLYLVTHLIHLAAQELQKCNEPGWTCLRGGKDLVYECSEQVGWNLMFLDFTFNLPNGCETWTVTGCHDVEVALMFYFSNESEARLKSFSVINTENLTLLPVTNDTHSPLKVFLKNIKWIDSFRKDMFMGTWESFYFNNVNIGRMYAGAFGDLVVTKDVVFKSTNIGLVDSGAFLNLSISSGHFGIYNSTIETVEFIAFDIKAPKVVIQNSFLSDIMLNAIKVEADEFILNNNSISRIIMPTAFVIHATEVTITNNYFGYLQTRALECISPKTEAVEDQAKYFFVDNTINQTDVGALHVDVIAYSQRKALIDTSNNKLFCSCENLDWLKVLADSSEQVQETELSQFYENLLFDESNMCINSKCNIPIHNLFHQPDLQCNSTFLTKPMCVKSNGCVHESFLYVCILLFLLLIKCPHNKIS